MQTNSFKNKGMYTEDLLNKTCSYYYTNDLLYVEKRSIPIKIVNKYKNKINGILLDKSKVDYNGLYKGFYFDFEAKETKEPFFNLCNIKKHQKDHLFFINKLKGISFLLISFLSENDSFFIITTDALLKLYEKKIKKISLDFCEKNFYKVNLIFPGILDILSFLEWYISNVKK